MQNPFTHRHFMQLKFYFLLTLFLSNCNQYSKNWNYTPESYNNSIERAAEDVSVEIFEENLEDKGQNNVSVLHLIPLNIFPSNSYYSSAFKKTQSSYHIKPKGTCVRQTDSAEKMMYNPSISLSYALFSEVKTSKMFQKANYICSDDDLDPKSRYLIKGCIKDMHVNVKNYAYGLSMYSFLLHIFGLPVNQIKSNLAITLELVDLSTNKTLFQKKYTAKPRSVLNNYYSLEDGFSHSEMSKEIYLEFMKDIADIIKTVKK